ncbi:cation-binding protein [Acidithiobacillus thiooxidans]|uniref:Cation-binding protein n=5 Tax=Acidithiobacillus thiooxidans TaxID=930 RepID=A0A1C2JFX1_ACITH|nr:hemerythrin domain-containing protein [Acidithiobacillus thiooxidans]OCX74436.1 cation-binding protein [Acidithiobacillus thiooxidans]OCX87143.1 cation-binding protein [Acidithiobacillus thiooxidans]OCX89034.1 cation-binding protein [Acidithiobacillus thiooxidans]OFC49192.1 cation-binding protein [Acidithiobacillus thiooxidans]
MTPIDQIMQQDHERLDQLLEQSAQAVGKGAWQEAAQLLEAFRHGIVDGHMVVEESTLFPAFELQEGGEDHPLTALLRKGHQDLRVFFEEMAEAIADQDAETFDDLLSTVQTILKQHDAKEETELYPYLAAALADQGEAAGKRILDFEAEARS